MGEGVSELHQSYLGASKLSMLKGDDQGLGRRKPGAVRRLRCYMVSLYILVLAVLQYSRLEMTRAE